jgi:phage baseplate assembly protein W
MGTQISIPFAVLENGSVATETDNDIQVSQRIDAIVSTEIGQRAMRAKMGLPLSRLLFDTNNILVATEMSDLVTQQINAYEPDVEVVSVAPNVLQANDGVASVNVNYRPIISASTVSSVANTVTVLVGGTVKEGVVNGNS